MKVQYLDHLGTDLSVVNAARASFDKESEWDLVSSEDSPHFHLKPADANLIRFLAIGLTSKEWDDLAQAFALETSPDAIKAMLWAFKKKATHFAPFCHPQVSFRITAPLSIARQAWKSHVGAAGGDAGYPAWSEESRRYVDSAPEFWLPKTWRTRPEGSIKQGSGEPIEYIRAIVSATATDGDVLIGGEEADAPTEFSQMAGDVYLGLLEQGVAPEQARLMLTNNTMVTWVWTGSLMFFARLCWLRQDGHAQQEIQALVEPIAEIMDGLFPVSWKALMEAQ